MTPNLSDMFSFAKMKDNASLKSAVDAQSQMARLFADHASAQIKVAGEMSRAVFEAGAKLASVIAEPARFEETAKEVSTDLSASMKAHSETMMAAGKTFQADLTAACAALAPKSA